MKILRIITVFYLVCMSIFSLLGEKRYPHTEKYFGGQIKKVEPISRPIGRPIVGQSSGQSRAMRQEKQAIEEEKLKIQEEKNKIELAKKDLAREKEEFAQEKEGIAKEKSKKAEEKNKTLTESQEKSESKESVEKKPLQEQKTEELPVSILPIDEPIKEPVTIKKETKVLTPTELFKRDIIGIKNITGLIALIDSLGSLTDKNLAAITKSELLHYSINIDGTVLVNIAKLADISELSVEEIKKIKDVIESYWNTLVKGSSPEMIDRNQVKESDKAVRDVLVARVQYPSLLDKDYSKKWETMKKQGPFFSQELFIQSGPIVIEDKKFENRLEGFIYYIQKILIDQLGKKAAFKKRDELRRLLGLSFDTQTSITTLFEKLYAAAGNKDTNQRAVFYNDLKGNKELFKQFLNVFKTLLYNDSLLNQSSAEFDQELYRSLVTAYINCILTVHGQPLVTQKSDRVLFAALKTFAVTVLRDESKMNHINELYSLLNEIRLHPSFGHYESWMGSVARKKFFELLSQLDKIALNGPKLEPLLEYLADPAIDQLAAPKEVTFEDKLFDDNEYLNELIDQNEFGQKKLVDVLIDVIVRHRAILKESKTEIKQEEQLTGFVSILSNLFKSKTSTQKKVVSQQEMLEIISKAVEQGVDLVIANQLIEAISLPNPNIAKITALCKKIADISVDAKDPEFITTVKRSVGSWLYQKELLAVVSDARNLYQETGKYVGIVIIKKINDILARSNQEENPLYKDLYSKKEALLRSTTWTPFQFYTVLSGFIPKDLLNKEILGGIEMQKGDQTYDWRARKTFYQWIEPYGIVFMVLSKWNELIADQEKDQLLSSVYNLALLKDAFNAFKTVGNAKLLKPGMLASSKPLEGNLLTKELSAKEYESILAQNPLGSAKFGFMFAGGVFEALPIDDLNIAFKEYDVLAIVRIMKTLLTLDQTEQAKSIGKQIDILTKIDPKVILAAGPPPPPLPPPPLPPKGGFPVKEIKGTDVAARLTQVRPSEPAEQSLLNVNGNALRYEMILNIIQQLANMKELVLTNTELPALGTATISQRSRTKDVYAYLAEQLDYLFTQLQTVIAKKPRDILTQTGTGSAVITKKLVDLDLSALAEKLDATITAFAKWLDSKKEVTDEAEKLYITNDIQLERDSIFAIVKEYIQLLKLRLVNIGKGLSVASEKKPEQKVVPIKITPGTIPPPPPPPPGKAGGKQGSPPPPPPPPPAGWKPKR